LPTNGKSDDEKKSDPGCEHKDSDDIDSKAIQQSLATRNAPIATKWIQESDRAATHIILN
jgi:hypothetical protein